MIRKFKVVFFDAGGTLFHPYPSVGEIYSEVASRHGVEANPEHLQRLFHEAWMKRDGLADLASHSSEKIERIWWRSLVEDVFKQVGTINDFEKFFDELYDLFARPQVWRLYPGALDVLDELKRRKKPMAIISNWDSRLFHLVDELGLRDYFQFVLASAVFGAAKPSPKIFHEALKRTGVKPEEAVHIGDSLEDDVQGASTVGMSAVLIDRSHKPRSITHPHLKHVKVIGDLKQLLEE